MAGERFKICLHREEKQGARLPQQLRALPVSGFFLTCIFQFRVTKKAGMKAKTSGNTTLNQGQLEPILDTSILFRLEYHCIK